MRDTLRAHRCLPFLIWPRACHAEHLTAWMELLPLLSSKTSEHASAHHDQRLRRHLRPTRHG